MSETLFHGDLVTSQRILYTPSSFAKANLVHLQETGTLQARQPHVSRRNDLSSYLFFLVKRGAGTLKYHGQSVALSAGDCVFIDCKSGYSHSTSQHLWTLQWVHFSGPTLPGIYQKYLERGGPSVFHPATLSAFEGALDRLYTIAGAADYLRDMHINEELTRLLTLLMAESWHPEGISNTTAKKQSLLSVRDYLDQNFAQKITLDHLAEEFFMNKYYLSHLFKEQFGLTVVEYLSNIRITHAKQLLRFSSLTAEAVGIACGMPDANYFSRVFRKLEGISPSEYRRIWKSK